MSASDETFLRLHLYQPQLRIDRDTTAEYTQDSSASCSSDELLQADVLSEILSPPAASAPQDSRPSVEPLAADSLSVDGALAPLTFAFADDSFSDDTDSYSDDLDIPLGDPTPDDYIFQCVLGDGSEGIVFLAIGRRDRKPYAVKVIPKEVLPEAQYGNLFASQFAMKAMKGCPFIIDLQAAFETTENFLLVFVGSLFSTCCYAGGLHFCQPFYANGDLKEEMQDVGRYSESETRTRIAQLVRPSRNGIFLPSILRLIPY